MKEAARGLGAFTSGGGSCKVPTGFTCWHALYILCEGLRKTAEGESSWNFGFILFEPIHYCFPTQFSTNQHAVSHSKLKTLQRHQMAMMTLQDLKEHRKFLGRAGMLEDRGRTKVLSEVVDPTAVTRYQHSWVVKSSLQLVSLQSHCVGYGCRCRGFHKVWIGWEFRNGRQRKKDNKVGQNNHEVRYRALAITVACEEQRRKNTTRVIKR